MQQIRSSECLDSTSAPVATCRISREGHAPNSQFDKATGDTRPSVPWLTCATAACRACPTQRSSATDEPPDDRTSTAQWCSEKPAPRGRGEAPTRVRVGGAPRFSEPAMTRCVHAPTQSQIASRVRAERRSSAPTRAASRRGYPVSIATTTQPDARTTAATKTTRGAPPFVLGVARGVARQSHCDRLPGACDVISPRTSVTPSTTRGRVMKHAPNGPWLRTCVSRRMLASSTRHV